jgi:hypothetical protein
METLEGRREDTWSGEERRAEEKRGEERTRTEVAADNVADPICSIFASHT